MRVTKQLAILAMLSLTLLTACGKTDANAKNFGAALTPYFDKHGQLCLNHYHAYPVTVTEMDIYLQKTWQSGTANQMFALEAAGLVQCEVADKGKHCSLTDAAKPFIREKEGTNWYIPGSQKMTQTDLCWGQKALDKIVKWEGPIKFGDYQEAEITYTYKVNDTADWAQKPEVQAAFPFIKSILEGAGTEQAKHGVKLTSQGWEAMGLD